MAYPFGSLKLEVKGAILSSQSWSIGLEFMLPGFGGIATSGDLTTWLAGTPTTAIATFQTALAPYRSLGVTWTSTSAQIYAAGPGPIASANVPAGTYTLGATGIAQNPRTCLVISKLTNGSGRSHRGRMYLPALAMVPNSTTGRTASGQGTTVMGFVKTLYNAIAAVPFNTINPVPAVLSPTTNAGYPITQLRVDDLFDTQRRREDKFQPAYATVAIP